MSDNNKVLIAPMIGLNIGQIAAIAIDFATRPRNNGELNKLRDEKIKKLKTWNEQNLVWQTVNLGTIQIGSISYPVVIEVSEVAKVDGYYIPVTATEADDFATQFKALPLTKRVADQLFNKGKAVPVMGQHDPTKESQDSNAYNPMNDFVKQSDYLKLKNYKGVFDFGAHKIWAYSAYKAQKCALKDAKDEATKKDYKEKYEKACEGDPNRIATNFGFYIAGKPFQDLGARHNASHWDYSQLLQLMRSKGSTIPIEGDEKGTVKWIDLKTAIEKKHPAIIKE